MTNPVVLIDASSYFFRAFHALPPLTNSKGQPTGAIYGVTNMIKRLVKDYRPEHIAVVFDAQGKTFRDDWYPAYKANRKAMPEELRSQFQPLLALLRAMGLPVIMVDGVEADDVIGTFAKEASQKKRTVLISTGDKDLVQLVNEHVTLINTMNNQTLEVSSVHAKFGVKPAQFIDYLTLIGDSTDNIPGVSKCGPKTAAKWLHDYETLDKLIANVDNIGGKIGEHLRASLIQLPLSKKLVTIKTDVDLPVSLDNLTPEPVNREKLLQLVREFEFKTWLKELLEDNERASAGELLQEEFEYIIINEEAQLQEWLHHMRSAPQLSVSIQTNIVDPLQGNIVGIGLALAGHSPVYIPLAHNTEDLQLPQDKTLLALKPILEDPDIAKIGQNLKFAYTVCKKYDIDLQGIAYDTLLESYVLNSTAAKHETDALSLKYLGHKISTLPEIVGTGLKQITFDQVLITKAAKYAAQMANTALKLHQKLYAMMDAKLLRVFHDIEMPLLTVIADMEYHGVLIHKATLEKHGERLKITMASLETEAYALAGKAFNLNSPKQLQDILFNDLKLPVLAKTPKGQPSTAESVLQELAYDYRLPAVILQYRSLYKLVTTYIDVLPNCINPKTNRVHTCYNQAVTATGRLSSSDPNLQNIPIRTTEGRLIRKAFIAPPQHVLLAADYSQIELRIMAHLSHDANLLHAFQQGWDIHMATASEIFGVPLHEVTKEQRRRSKAVNFGLIYGMSSFGLGKQIGVSREEAQAYIDRYFQRYPGVWDYMERTRTQARQTGYVETIFGRRLHVPEITVSNMVRQKAAERMAINAPMQGSAADIIKKAMLAIAQWQKVQTVCQSTMVMQVHDELIFEVQEEAVEHISSIVKQIMENTVELSVPLLVSIGIGHNWDEAH